MWIARNEDGELELFKTLPKRHILNINYDIIYRSGKWVIEEITPEHTWHFPGAPIDKNLFPNLKWEDEPIEVELKAIPKAKPISQLWEEWRYTNEWKANCQYTTFDQFLIDRGIKYTVE